MTDFRLEDSEDDFGTLVMYPGQDDSFEVGGYAERGRVALRLPIYAHEAAELIELLTPLAAKAEGGEAP
jgi:hypothetical protein